MAADWFVEKLRRGVEQKKAAGAGMTEIAFYCGVSTQQLRDYLRGENQPKIERFRVMSDYFGWNERPFDDEPPAEELASSTWSEQTASDLRREAAVRDRVSTLRAS